MTTTKKPIVTVDGLKKEAKTYDPALRTLPFFSVKGMCEALKLNIVEVDNEHVIVNKRRKAGGTGSYKPGKEIKYMDELSKYSESSLKPELTVCKTKDNVQNYDDSNVIFQGGKPVDQKKKNHPLERTIIEDVVKSHGEDIVFSAFNAERDEDVDSPSTCMNGFFTKMDMAIATGDINAARGNYALSGEFKMPTNEQDHTAYENLVEWIGGSHTLLRSSVGGTPQILIAENAMVAVRAAFRLKVRMFDYPTMEQVIQKLREDALCPSLLVCTHESLGTGSRLILQKLGNMDFGFNTGKSDQFVQVRDIYEDPNEVQFWLQAAYDTRIRDMHAKVFRTNEQTNVSLDLAGDYVETGAAQCNITGALGKWRAKGKITWRDSGQYAIGLPTGDVVIEFAPIEGFNTPAEQTITIKEAEVTIITAAYTSK